MTDTITLPSGVEVYEGRILVVPGIASLMPPGDLTPAEVQALRDDVASVMNLEMGDLANVDDADRAEGYVLQWDENAAEWTAAPSVKGIESVWSSRYVPDQNPRTLQFWGGLYLQAHPSNPEMTRVHMDMGSSGTSSSAARSDHAHTQPLPVRATAAPSGYMGGGSRAIGSPTPVSVTLANGIPYVVEAELYGQFRGADPGAAYYTLTLNIGGNTRTSPGGTGEFSCVQGVPDKFFWEHSRRMTGTGGSVGVSASVSFHSGSGFNVDRTYLKVRLRPDR